MLTSMIIIMKLVAFSIELCVYRVKKITTETYLTWTSSIKFLCITSDIMVQSIAHSQI